MIHIPIEQQIRRRKNETLKEEKIDYRLVMPFELVRVSKTERVKLDKILNNRKDPF